MSQTVKIDAAAQDAIAEIVGMPWEKGTRNDKGIRETQQRNV